MKKSLALILSLMMLIAMLAACGGDNNNSGNDSDTSTSQDADSENPADSEDENGEDNNGATANALGTLTVGTSELNGDFIEGFGNSSYDKYVKDILGGFYSTYETTPAGEFILNENVVEDYDTVDNADGTKTYTFKIKEGLQWSDGSDLTAKDYVFQILVYESREWTKAGGTSPFRGYGLVGYDEYNAPYTVIKEVPVDELDQYGDDAVIVNDADSDDDAEAEDDADADSDDDAEAEDDADADSDDDADAEDDADEVETVQIEVPNDAPTSEYFKGVEYISEYEFAVTIKAENLPYFYEVTYALFSPICAESWAPGCEIEQTEEGARITGVDLLSSLQNVAGNERFAPTVTCGPYKFVSFQNQIVTLERNDYFVGDLDGEKGKFENVVVKAVNQETDVDQVIAGDIDLSTGVIQGAKIEKAKAADTADLHSYLRAGFGMMAFHCDWGVTADPNVRWGVASLLDRSAVLDYVLEGYGGTVDGPFGLATWMYQERKDVLDSELKPIAFNIDKANEYFDLTEWKFEADGTTPFDAEKATEDGSYMRYNSAGEPFVLRHLGTVENEVTDIIEIQFTANAPLAGLDFQVTKGDFATLLDNYYEGFTLGDDRTYNSFNLASNFPASYDPYTLSYHSDKVGTWENSVQLADAELDKAIDAMRFTDPEDPDAFADAFVDYVVRWNELLPEIPLYSNEYFDIYNTSIAGLESSPYHTWANTVCKIYPVED